MSSQRCPDPDRYHVGGYPLYTLSNWGWHTPDPAAYGVKQPVFNADGTLNYVYENVSISSVDARPGKGNRTVPYVWHDAPCLPVAPRNGQGTVEGCIDVRVVFVMVVGLYL